MQRIPSFRFSRIFSRLGSPTRALGEWRIIVWLIYGLFHTNHGSVTGLSTNQVTEENGRDMYSIELRYSICPRGSGLTVVLCFTSMILSDMCWTLKSCCGLFALGLDSERVKMHAILISFELWLVHLARRHSIFGMMRDNYSPTTEWYEGGLT